MSHLEEGQLHALLDGELGAEERQAAEAHLAACAGCRAQFDEARAFLAEADQLISGIELPPASRPHSAPALSAAPPAIAATRPARRLPRRALAWAATVVLAVGLGFGSSELRRRRFADDQAATAVRAPVGAAAPGPLTEIARAPIGTVTTKPAVRDRLEAPTVTADAARGEALGGARSAKAAAAPAAPAAIDAPASSPAPSLALAEPRARQDAGLTGEAAQSAPTQPAAPNAASSDPPRAAGSVERKAAEEAPVLRNGLSPADARRAVLPASALRRVDMASAVRVLGGTIRLVDGLTPTMVLAGPGAAISGADPNVDLVRVVYEDPPSRELWLDQQRFAASEAPGRRAAADREATTLLPGDTLVAPAVEGARSLRWIDHGGFRLGLTGHLSADSLRAIIRRVQ